MQAHSVTKGKTNTIDSAQACKPLKKLTAKIGIHSLHLPEVVLQVNVAENRL
jgi:hypothetical protein